MNKKILLTITIVALHISSQTLCMKQLSSPVPCLPEYLAECTKILNNETIKSQQYKAKTLNKDFTQEKDIVCRKLYSDINVLLKEKQKLLDDIEKHHTIDKALRLEPLITDKQTSTIHIIALQKMCSEMLPIFSPCLNNHVVTSCMLQLMFNYYCQDFTTQDYKLLSKINRHWNAFEWINQAEKIPSSVRELL